MLEATENGVDQQKIASSKEVTRGLVEGRQQELLQRRYAVPSSFVSVSWRVGEPVGRGELPSFRSSGCTHS